MLVAVGQRSATRPGWRAGISMAVEIVARAPRLWLYGALAFCLRGGIVALTVPIIVLPTQVEVRAILGGNLGSSGFTDGFWWMVSFGAIAATGALVAIAAALAWLELASFERVADRVGSREERRATRLQLFAVQLLALIALAIAAIPLALAVGEGAYEEVLRPSGTGSIYDRVLARVSQPIFLLIVAVVTVELLSALASREVLARAARSGAAGSGTGRTFAHALAAALVRPLRFPIRTLATAALGWVITVAAVAASAWLIGLAWQSVRSRFLTSVAFGNLGADISADVEMFIIATALAAAFVAGILATGFASALRGASWSVERLS